MKPPAVKLDELLEIFEFNTDEMQAWLDRQAGSVAIMDDSVMRAVESADEDNEEAARDGLPDWQAEQVPMARAILQNDPRYLALPNKVSFHEYRHMEQFIDSITSSDDAEQLRRAITGKGAFRRFEHTAHRLGQMDAWYRYRDEAIKRHLLDWAAGNGIEIDQDSVHHDTV